MKQISDNFKKRWLPIILFLALTVCLAGCTSSASKAEKEQVQLGKTLMQDYLTAYIPGGKVKDVMATTEAEPGFGTKHYLTEYVNGTYVDEDGLWRFEVNTETGELYSSKYFDRLKKLVGEKILEKLELEDKATITFLGKSKTVLPHHCEVFGHRYDEFQFFENPDDAPDVKYMGFDDVLPIAMVDVDGYLAREDRPTIYVTACDITMAEGLKAPELSEDMFPLCWDGIQVDQITFKIEKLD